MALISTETTEDLTKIKVMAQEMEKDIMDQHMDNLSAQLMEWSTMTEATNIMVDMTCGVAKTEWVIKAMEETWCMDHLNMATWEVVATTLISVILVTDHLY